MNEAKKSAGKKTQGSLMYLGPTIPGVVRYSTVFESGLLPQKVKDCMEQFPLMEKLFVSIEDSPAAAKELNKEQSALRTVYFQAAKKFVKLEG